MSLRRERSPTAGVRAIYEPYWHGALRGRGRPPTTAERAARAADGGGDADVALAVAARPARARRSPAARVALRARRWACPSPSAAGARCGCGMGRELAQSSALPRLLQLQKNAVSTTRARALRRPSTAIGARICLLGCVQEGCRRRLSLARRPPSARSPRPRAPSGRRPRALRGERPAQRAAIAALCWLTPRPSHTASIGFCRLVRDGLSAPAERAHPSRWPFHAANNSGVCRPARATRARATSSAKRAGAKRGGGGGSLSRTRASAPRSPRGSRDPKRPPGVGGALSREGGEGGTGESATPRGGGGTRTMGPRLICAPAASNSPTIARAVLAAAAAAACARRRRDAREQGATAHFAKHSQ